MHAMAAFLAVWRQRCAARLPSVASRRRAAVHPAVDGMKPSATWSYGEINLAKVPNIINVPRIVQRLCLVGLIAALPVTLHAAEAAGEIRKSQGQATIERGGQALPARVGTAVFAADRLRTGADGKLGVALVDGTLLSSGPNSLISLEKFRYNPKTDAGAMSVGVNKGSLAVATGKIAKKTPESVDFHTPTTVLGVRGTEFLISVEGED